MNTLYPSPSHPPQAKSSDALKREQLQSAKEMFGRPPAPPSPAPPAELPAHLFTPSPDQIKTACSCNGADEGKARTSHIARVRSTLHRLHKMLPEVARVITADLVRAEDIRQVSLTALSSADEALNALRGKLGERADLRERIAATKADFETSKATLASRESLTLDGATLATLTAKAQHLPAEIRDLENGFAPLTAEIERLTVALKVELPSIVQSFYKEAATRHGSGFTDPTFKNRVDAGLI